MPQNPYLEFTGAFAAVGGIVLPICVVFSIVVGILAWGSEKSEYYKGLFAWSLLVTTCCLIPIALNGLRLDKVEMAMPFAILFGILLVSLFVWINFRGSDTDEGKSAGAMKKNKEE